MYIHLKYIQRHLQLRFKDAAKQQLNQIKLFEQFSLVYVYDNITT